MTRGNGAIERGHGRGLVALLAAALAVLAAAPAPARADSQSVQATDIAFKSPGVAVKPGESVTWSYPSGSDRHNVHFETLPFQEPPSPSGPGWTPRPDRTLTFPKEGTYRYYCDEHGGPGGQGMSGIVHVNADGIVPGVAPTASFTVTPTLARVGQSVAFAAVASSDPDPMDSIVRYEWDFDGDGSFETDTGAQSATAHTYTTAGTKAPKLRVTDGQGHTTETTRSLSVTSAPVASFVASPNPAQPGQTVSFDGSGSNDPDGTVAKYEWDLDGNGSFETDTGAVASAARAYADPATVTVRLRVTDNLGVVSDAVTRSLQVAAPTGPPSATPTPTPTATSGPIPTPTGTPVAPKPKGCSSLKGAKRAACVQKSCRKLKGAKRAACLRKSCQYLKGAKRKACVRKYRRKR